VLPTQDAAAALGAAHVATGTGSARCSPGAGSTSRQALEMPLDLRVGR